MKLNLATYGTDLNLINSIKQLLNNHSQQPNTPLTTTTITAPDGQTYTGYNYEDDELATVLLTQTNPHMITINLPKQNHLTLRSLRQLINQHLQEELHTIAQKPQALVTTAG